MTARVSRCGDCRVSVTPGKRSDRPMPPGRWEWYMVHHELWAAAQAAGEACRFLCIGCLEERLGRRLTMADFTGAPVNLPHDLDAPRLEDRKNNTDGVECPQDTDLMRAVARYLADGRWW